MSNLKYSSYPGLGAQNLQNFHYNQAVRLPAGADRVELAGQGTLQITIGKKGTHRRHTPQKRIAHPPHHEPTNLTLTNPSFTLIIGGWDPSNGNIRSDLLEEIDQAFSNVQLALRDAGVEEGWKKVFRVNSYHVGFEGDQERVLGRMVKNLKEWCPGHAPVWTCVGVTALGMPEMRVEIEVVAVDGV